MYNVNYLFQSIATTGAKITIEHENTKIKQKSIPTNTMTDLKIEKEDRNIVESNENLLERREESDVIVALQKDTIAVAHVSTPVTVSVSLSSPVRAVVLPVFDQCAPSPLVPLADPSPLTGSAPWVSCCLCGLDCTWVYIMHSDASRALVTHRCK